jgi:uncharacterized protein YjbI with pentapeptide repeats
VSRETRVSSKRATVAIRHQATGALLHTVEAETLEGTNLSRCKLRGADLRGANLRGARLWRTDLREANLERPCQRPTDMTHSGA